MRGFDDVVGLIRAIDGDRLGTSVAWPEWCGGDEPNGICGAVRPCRVHGGTGVLWGAGLLDNTGSWGTGPTRPPEKEAAMAANKKGKKSTKAKGSKQSTAPKGRKADAPTPPEHKTCSRCDTEKPAAEFYRNKRSSDGLSGWCKDCNRSHAREKREEAKAKAKK